MRNGLRRKIRGKPCYANVRAAPSVGPSSLDSREIFPTSVFRFVYPPLRLSVFPYDFFFFFPLKVRWRANPPRFYPAVLSRPAWYTFKINVQCTYGFLRLARAAGMCCALYEGIPLHTRVYALRVHTWVERFRVRIHGVYREEVNREKAYGIKYSKYCA